MKQNSLQGWRMRRGNKKAELSFKQVIFMFARFVILIIILFSIVYTTKRYIITTAEISDTESEIMLRSLMTNKGSVVYYDEKIDRVYPYTIDLNRMKSAYADEFEDIFDWGEPERMFAARVMLFDMDGKKYQGAETMYINKRHYSEWKELARARFPGPGSATEKTKQYYVNVIEDGTLKRGIAEVSVVIPGS